MLCTRLFTLFCGLLSGERLLLFIIASMLLPRRATLDQDSIMLGAVHTRDSPCFDDFTVSTDATKGGRNIVIITPILQMGNSGIEICQTSDGGKLGS